MKMFFGKMMAWILTTYDAAILNEHDNGRGSGHVVLHLIVLMKELHNKQNKRKIPKCEYLSHLFVDCQESFLQSTGEVSLS